eukprot:3211569-Rhodomonas_salina.1
MQILEHLVVTKKDGIRYSARVEDYHGHARNQLYAYVDSSFADDIPSRKSTLGFLIFINGTPIGFRSKQSPIVVASTGHAEYVAAALCVQD